MANYNEMTSKELRNICKERGISYNVTKDGVKHTFTKDEMVNALYDFDDKNEVEQDSDVKDNNETVQVEETVEQANEVPFEISENTSIEDLLKVRGEIDSLIKNKARNLNSAVNRLSGNKVHTDERNEQYDENWSMYGGVDPNSFIHTKDKSRYIEEAEEGTLFAFLDENGKPRTAALVNRSSSRQVVKLMTEYDWEFVVPYSRILWVKKGKKWAYGVYRILKGYDPNGKCGTIGSEDSETE